MSELEKYKIQLQQVEAALIGEPANEDLLKLKEDLNEIIELQLELIGSGADANASTTTSNATGASGSVFSDKITWKVGDRCLAPTKSGQRHVAVIDGISQDKVAITFAANGKKDMVRLSDLTPAPIEEKKKYIFQTGKTGGSKKEWQMERERRKARAQKKEQRRKNMDEAKEQEKSKWKNFNAKAESKSLKGLKRVIASGSSADGGRAAPNRNTTIISSRRDYQSFGATLRGNMESLF